METKRIKVMILNKQRGIQVKYIDDTLEAKQEIVGGLIEYTGYTLGENQDIELIVNEEGRYLDLDETLMIHHNMNIQTVLLGNVIITKSVDTEDGREAISLTREDIVDISRKLGTYGICNNNEDLDYILGLNIA